MYPPEPPRWIDLESTYGDRKHPEKDPIDALANILAQTAERGGVLLIPSFAVGRAHRSLCCPHEVFVVNSEPVA